VWLVGASSGIGRALASALHERGARVVLSARQAEALQEFVAQHPGSVALPLDVCQPKQVQAAAQSLLQSGPIDLVCYLAGHFPKRFTRLMLLLRLLPYRWYFAAVRRGTGL